MYYSDDKWRATDERRRGSRCTNRRCHRYPRKHDMTAEVYTYTWIMKAGYLICM